MKFLNDVNMKFGLRTKAYKNIGDQIPFYLYDYFIALDIFNLFIRKDWYMLDHAPEMMEQGSKNTFADTAQMF